MYLLYYVVLIVVFILIFFKLPKTTKYKNIQYFLYWIGLIIGTIFIYTLKDEVFYYVKNNEIMAYLMPGKALVEGNNIKFKKSMDGHFYIISTINNVNIKFLVDTGATDTVLSIQDALKIGIDVKSLSYTDSYHTANGVIYAAPVRINELSIAGKSFYNIKVAISNSEMSSSLLGMSFLENFGFSIEGDTLMIKI